MSHTLKQWLSLALLTTLMGSIFASSAPQHGQPINRIVAIVNNTPITQSQVNQMLQTAPQDAAQPTEQMVIEALVNQALQLDVAQRAGVTVSDADVDQAIVHIAAQNQLTVDQLKTKVLQGMSWLDYQNQIKQQMLMNKIQQQAVSGKVNVSDAQIAQFIKDHGDQLGTQTQYQYSDLLIPTSDQVNDTQAISFAKTAIADFKPGMSLADLVKKLPAKANATMLLTSVTQTPDQIPDLFLTALNSLKQGAVSKPLSAGNGVHILQLDQKQIASLSLQKQRAIGILMQQAFLKAVKDWVDTLKKSAYIQIFPSQDNA